MVSPGPFDHVVFAVIDVETTGLSPHDERLIEVAVITINGAGDELGRWSTLVRPDDRALTGRLVAVADAPTFGEVAGDLLGQLRRGVIVGHNVRFDLRFLDAELTRQGAALPRLDYIDTHRLATLLEVDTPNRSLALLCSALEVDFASWHTAEGDADATARLVIQLLRRAEAWGHTSIARFISEWASDDGWPTIPATGRLLRRDPVLFRPGGRQPGAASVQKPSWRRHGTGDGGGPTDNALSLRFEIDTSVFEQAVVSSLAEALDARPPDTDPPDWPDDWRELAEMVRGRDDRWAEAALLLGTWIMAKRNAERPPDPADDAMSDWYAGDFHGHEGIDRLERITFTLEGRHDHLTDRIEAFVVLADLYRRHGGRHEDVSRAFAQAFDLAITHCEATVGSDDDLVVGGRCDEVARLWWEYLAKRRDVAGLAQLFDRLTDSRARYPAHARPAMLAAQSITAAAKGGETIVASQLFDALLPALARHGSARDLGEACYSIATALEAAGQQDAAVEICELAWASGWATQELANRHSLILERAKRFADAAIVAEKGLPLPSNWTAGARDSLEKRRVRCLKKL
jgi:DNA polymerase III epsilon subunit-like protein